MILENSGITDQVKPGDPKFDLTTWGLKFNPSVLIRAGLNIQHLNVPDVDRVMSWGSPIENQNSYLHSDSLRSNPISEG